VANRTALIMAYPRGKSTTQHKSKTDFLVCAPRIACDEQRVASERESSK
jgi:hypothetical protein